MILDANQYSHIHDKLLIWRSADSLFRKKGIALQKQYICLENWLPADLLFANRFKMDTHIFCYNFEPMYTYCQDRLDEFSSDAQTTLQESLPGY